MLPMTSRRLAACAALASLPLLGACSRFSDASTEAAQSTSEGAQVMVGQVRADSLVVVASAKGGSGVLSGALVNTGTAAVTVSVASEGAPNPVTIDVPAAGLVRLGTDTAPSAGVAGTSTVLLPSVSVAPGSYVTILLATATGGQVPAQVPVVTPQGVYATLTPAPSPSVTPQG